jgi:glycosyltransferase involved in cell wall biosynthesis
MSGRILVLSFYYAPDLCAGSFRATPFVAALQARAPPGTHIDVITTLPNRYQTFERDAEACERSEGLEIRRIRLPRHQSDLAGQSRAFAEFARSALRIAADRSYDLVFATSSRLMTAALGAWIARRKRAALYLDIRDLFVDTIGDVFSAPAAWPASRFFSLIERWTVTRADRVNLVSRGFEGYFRQRYGDRSLAWFTHGIDDEFLNLPAELRTRDPADPRVTILYAGNIGAGQGLHDILPGMARGLRARARFVVIGDGGRRKALQAALTAAGADNVELRPPVSRTALLQAYRAADVLFLHLGAHRAFEKVLPSKLFEYAALGKPVLAGVAGYAAEFVRAEIENAAVFAPCKVTQGIRAFESLELVDRPRASFTAKYARARIVGEMAQDVLKLLEQRAGRTASELSTRAAGAGDKKQLDQLLAFVLYEC